MGITVYIYLSHCPYMYIQIYLNFIPYNSQIQVCLLHCPAYLDKWTHEHTCCTNGLFTWRSISISFAAPQKIGIIRAQRMCTCIHTYSDTHSFYNNLKILLALVLYVVVQFAQWVREMQKVKKSNFNCLLLEKILSDPKTIIF